MSNLPSTGTPQAADYEIDVRQVPRNERHPLVFAEYEQLDLGQSVILVNDHEPRHLREEFDRELAGSFAWEPEPGSSDENGWRIRITKQARTALPRLVGDAHCASDTTDAGGSVWQLSPAGRDLDANVIVLPPSDEIPRHDGPDLDVLVLVLDGSGTLQTELGTIPLRPRELVWLPARSQRRFLAGDDGLRYLSVHHRKPALTITQRPVDS